MSHETDALRTLPIFGRLSDQQLSLVVRRLKDCKLAPSDILFEMGDPGDALYIVRHGSIEIYVTDDQNETVVLSELEPGEYFGEMSLIDGRPRSASARACGDTELLMLTRPDFQKILDLWPSLSLNLISDISGRLRDANQNVQSLAKSLSLANQQIEVLDQLKTSFVGLVTHELRTPFANIDFSLQLFERHGVENLLPEQKEELHAIKHSLTKAKDMVEKLVGVASFLNKQGKLELDSVTLRPILRDALMSLEQLATAKGVHLHTRFIDQDTEFIGDAKRLHDAVYQLVHNAIKFTEEEGRVMLQCWQDNTYLYFEVRDTGIGIPAEKLATLWDPFAQMADPERRGAEGLGLGLSLVKYVIDAHGGQVWATSRRGRGSTFGFNLPRESGVGVRVEATPEQAVEAIIE